MNPIELIKKALDSYQVYIKMGEHYYQEVKIRRTEECLSYLEDKEKIDREWLFLNCSFLTEVLEEYRNSLKREIEDSYDQNEICSLREERKQITRMLAFLKRSSIK